MFCAMETSVATVLLSETPSAIPAVAKWLFDEWGHRNPDGSLERSVSKLSLRSNVDRLPIAILAVADGQPVGTASIVESEDPGDEYGPWVSGVYVLPKFRGREIATMLMNRLEAEAVRLDAVRE